MRETSADKYRTKRPWNDAQQRRLAKGLWYPEIVHAERRFGKSLRFVPWSLNVLWELRSAFLVWLRDCVEQDSFNIWVSATTPSSSGSSLDERDPLPWRACVPSDTLCQNTIKLGSWRGVKTGIRKQVWKSDVLSAMKWATPLAWTASSRCGTGTKGKRVWCSWLSHRPSGCAEHA